jgi:hypothetical protein
MRLRSVNCYEAHPRRKKHGSIKSSEVRTSSTASTRSVPMRLHAVHGLLLDIDVPTEEYREWESADKTRPSHIFWLHLQQRCSVNNHLVGDEQRRALSVPVWGADLTAEGSKVDFWWVVALSQRDTSFCVSWAHEMKSVARGSVCSRSHSVRQRVHVALGGPSASPSPVCSSSASS